MLYFCLFVRAAGRMLTGDQYAGATRIREEERKGGDAGHCGSYVPPSRYDHVIQAFLITFLKAFIITID